MKTYPQLVCFQKENLHWKYAMVFRTKRGNFLSFSLNFSFFTFLLPSGTDIFFTFLLRFRTDMFLYLTCLAVLWRRFSQAGKSWWFYLLYKGQSSFSYPGSFKNYCCFNNLYVEARVEITHVWIFFAYIAWFKEYIAMTLFVL